MSKSRRRSKQLPRGCFKGHDFKRGSRGHLSFWDNRPDATVVEQDDIHCFVFTFLKTGLPLAITTSAKRLPIALCHCPFLSKVCGA
jgi:hypothetical protein